MSAKLQVDLASTKCQLSCGDEDQTGLHFQVARNRSRMTELEPNDGAVSTTHGLNFTYSRLSLPNLVILYYSK
jgi:hypothetical protein